MDAILGFMAWVWMLFTRPLSTIPTLLIYLPLRYTAFFVGLFTALALAFAFGPHSRTAVYIFVLLACVVGAMRVGAFGQRTGLVERVKRRV